VRSAAGALPLALYRRGTGDQQTARVAAVPSLSTVPSEATAQAIALLDGRVVGGRAPIMTRSL